MYDNVNLWFAKNINNNIVTIDDIEVKDNSKNKYYCPLCGSKVIPKNMRNNDCNISVNEKDIMDYKNNIITYEELKQIVFNKISIYARNYIYNIKED